MKPSLSDDLERIGTLAEGTLSSLRGQRIFLAGATGFFGLWLLETICWANRELSANIQVVGLSRQTSPIDHLAPHLQQDRALTFIQGDISDFNFPDGHFDLIIHGATTSARETFNGEPAVRKFNTVVAGTQRILQFAQQSKPGRMLYLSSGAVYGNGARTGGLISESCNIAPAATESQAALGLGKLSAEFLCHEISRQAGLNMTIARCFSFYGPYLPIDIHYALGNFVADGIAGRPIRVNGNGAAVRSYLYISDLIVWLLAMAASQQPTVTYNVGSDQPLSILELANHIGQQFDQPVLVGSNTVDETPDSYVPDITRIQRELDVACWTPLSEGIEKMASHIRSMPALYNTPSVKRP